MENMDNNELESLMFRVKYLHQISDLLPLFVSRINTSRIVGARVKDND